MPDGQIPCQKTISKGEFRAELSNPLSSLWQCTVAPFKKFAEYMTMVVNSHLNFEVFEVVVIHRNINFGFDRNRNRNRYRNQKSQTKDDRIQAQICTFLAV